MPFRSGRTFCGLGARVVVLLAGLLAAGLSAVAAYAFDARRVEPSVYKIYSLTPQKNDQYSISSGSGFLVSGQRYVVTNFHVIEGGERFYIAFRSGREAKLIEARRVESRSNVDLALLEAREDLPGEALTLGEYEPEKLAEVVAIGFPGAANLNKLVAGADAQGVPLTDLDSTVTTGVVSRMTFTSLKVSESQTLSVRTVQHSSAINPGNSGGPLFDACSQVVGVNTLQGLNSQGLFFSVHADEVGRFLRDLRIPFSATSRSCSASVLGAGLVPLAVALAAALALAAAVILLRTNRAPAWLEALPKAASDLGLPGLSRRAKVHAPADSGPLCLRPVDGGSPIRLEDSGRAITIGRGPGADVTIASDTVSKVHARLTYDPKADRIRITDLNSSNGTFVDGAHVTETEAPAGAIVRLGTMEFKVARETRASVGKVSGATGGGWMLSGFDPSGRAVQFELRPPIDPGTGREVPATWTFGRDPGRADFVIDDSSVSSLHAQIMYDPGAPLTLRDMGSMNGTRLDGESIGNSTATLRDTGQEIVFGLASLRLSRLSG